MARPRRSLGVFAFSLFAALMVAACAGSGPAGDETGTGGTSPTGAGGTTGIAGSGSAGITGSANAATSDRRVIERGSALAMD